MSKVKIEFNSQRSIFVVVLFLLICVHFFIVNYLTVPFPFWGDDLVFIDFVRRINQGELSFLQWYYPFHGGIHANALFKIFLCIQFLIFKIINYKLSVIFGQLSFVILMYYFLKYFKKLSVPIFTQLAFFFLLFSLKGNSDNFNLLGILQHTATICVITVSGYFTLVKRNLFVSFCIANLGLLMISTEVMGALLIFCGITLIVRPKNRYLYLIISSLNVIIYILGINYSNSLLHQTTSNIHFSIHFFQGMLIFMGGLFSNFLLIAALGFSYIFIHILSFLQIEGSFFEKIQNPKFFPNFIFLAVLFIGAMIQIGRTDNPNVDHAFNTSIAQRFSFYHLTFLLSTFLAFIQIQKVKTFVFSIFVLFFSIFFYSFNLLKTWNKLSIDINRIYLDAYNYRFAFDNLTYGAEEQNVKKLVNSNVMYFPDFQELKNMKLRHEFQVTQIGQDGQFTVLVSDHPQLNNIALIQTSDHKYLFAQIIDPYSKMPMIKVSPNWLEKNKIEKIFVMK